MDAKTKPELKLKNQQVMLERFPKDWPGIAEKELDWYVGKYNMDTDSNYGLWYVMVLDRKDNMLYFFHSAWDYTP